MEKIRLARLDAMTRAPYYAQALAAMPLIPNPEMPFPAGVDKWGRCFYNPNIVEKLPLRDITFILLHEVSHLLRGHDRRRGGRDALVQVTVPDEFSPDKPPKQQTILLWNIACDLAINSDLREMLACEPPAYVPLPEAFGLPPHRTPEEYYDQLLKEGKQLPFSGGGSCADGDPRPWEEEAGSEYRKMTDVERKMLERTTAREILNHKKTRGDVPAGLLRWAEEVLNPKIPWQQILRASLRLALQMTSVSKVDYTWRRPSRREAVMGGDFRLPGLQAPIPRVAVGIDTSGSMSDRELAVAIAEVKGILRALGTEITVLSGDVEVHTKQVIRDVARIKLAGGGGTDMRNILKAMAEMSPPPDVAVVITDGYTPWPPTRPPQLGAVIVLLTDPDGDCPAWAKKVVYDER